MADSVLLAAAFVGLLVHPLVLYVLYRWLTPTPEQTTADREAMAEGAGTDRVRERRIPGGDNE